MNKQELRADYISRGWEVQPVSDWRLVQVNVGKALYDVNVVNPKDEFCVAQVVVVNDNGIDETATPKGVWKDATPDFAARLREYLDSIEGAAGVFAIAVANMYASDQVAECLAYKTDGSVTNYVVKERNDTFSFKALT